MLKFYKIFDPIQFKYSLGETYDYQMYGELETSESFYQFAEMTKMEYGDIINNLDLIYAGKDHSDNIVFLFDLIRNKIISQYIGIDGLERLFSEKYIDFEWDMHLGIDYRKHKMSYYRDHFVHQIRNAYCMHMLLQEFGWFEKIKEVLKDCSYSKVSAYVYKYIEQQKKSAEDKPYNHISDFEEFCYKNVIYMSAYMSALFHDIGYPEMFNTVNQQRITEYIANLYNAESTGYNYVRLNALLQNSLLFRVVSFEEIRGKLSNGKPDHGTLSAIIFLLNFYENGAIHGLEPYKRCAVELAALAIYNHTNNYCYEGAIKAGHYAKNSFVLNPISYLLRLCDDLQEWDRIYFELSNKSNMIICNTCKTPIVRKKHILGDSGSETTTYLCNCNYTSKRGKIDKKSVFWPVFDYDNNFAYRRIYNVIVCDQLEIIENDDDMCFFLDYRLDRLLHIAYINPNYARIRAKELNQLKKMLDYQQVLPVMKLKYFISANPVLIKTKIVTEYLLLHNSLQSELEELSDELLILEQKEQVSDGEKNQFDEHFKNLADAMKELINQIISSVYSGKAKHALIKGNVKKAVSLYIDLSILMYFFQEYNQQQFEVGDVLKEKCSEIKSKYNDCSCDDLKGLIEDCINQFAYFYEDVCEIEANPEEYYCQFESSAYAYGCIERFTSARRYNPVCEHGKYLIDAYTDLALIQEILKELYKA